MQHLLNLNNLSLKLNMEMLQFKQIIIYKLSGSKIQIIFDLQQQKLILLFQLIDD